MVSESVALETTHPHSDSNGLNVLPFKDGFTKIRLAFLTDKPKHVRSLMLQQTYGSKPPFVEDVCVLMPCDETFSILETFFSVFKRLQEAGVVDQSAKLLEFKVLDEDTQTLAYLVLIS